MASQHSCGAFLMTGALRACSHKLRTAKRHRGNEVTECHSLFKRPRGSEEMPERSDGISNTISLHNSGPAGRESSALACQAEWIGTMWCRGDSVPLRSTPAPPTVSCVPAGAGTCLRRAPPPTLVRGCTSPPAPHSPNPFRRVG